MEEARADAPGNDISPCGPQIHRRGAVRKWQKCEGALGLLSTRSSLCHAHSLVSPLQRRLHSCHPAAHLLLWCAVRRNTPPIHPRVSAERLSARSAGGCREQVMKDPARATASAVRAAGGVLRASRWSARAAGERDAHVTVTCCHSAPQRDDSDETGRRCGASRTGLRRRVAARARRRGRPCERVKRRRPIFP